MPPPATSPAMREFGYGARRALEPYRSPDAQTYQDPNVKPYFRMNQLPAAERNSLAYSDYARQQDNMVLQEDQINQQLAAQREKLGQDKRKVARLEQVQDVEDQANEALASGVPVDQVIQKFPGLAQSPSFGNYMQQVKAIPPAQQTLAPHYRKMLKRPEERADFDQAFQRFGNVSQADDYARTRAAERAHRVDLIESGVPLEHIEKAGPLNAERAALLKQQYKVSATGGNPHAMKGYEEWLKLRSQGAKEEAEALRAELADQGINIFPPKPVAAPPTAPSVSGGATAAGAPMSATSSAAPAAVVEEGFPTPEKVQQAKAAHIGAPDADENFYSSLIADPKTPLPQKKAALEKFKQYVQNPPKKAGDTIGSAIARRKALEKDLAQAEENVEFHPVREQFSNDWQKSKNEMGEYIRRFANSLGVDENEAIASLKENEELNIAAPGERPQYSRVRPLFENFVAKKLGTEKLRPFLRSTDERLSGYSNHKFAPKLGVSPFSLPGFPNAGRIIALGQQPVSNEDVLNSYLEDATRKGSQRVGPILPRVATPEEAAKLPPGTQFIDPSGVTRTVPRK